ncbi:hypothetical protein Plhal304r1_c028g0091961 [Plasmopara halstedii]
MMHYLAVLLESVWYQCHALNQTHMHKPCEVIDACDHVLGSPFRLGLDRSHNITMDDLECA